MKDFKIIISAKTRVVSTLGVKMLREIEQNKSFLICYRRGLQMNHAYL